MITQKNKKYIFFYATLLYILVFLFWWTFLLYEKTKLNYFNEIKVQQIKYTQKSYESSIEYLALKEKYKRDKIMIIAEGLVFTILLIFLVFKVKKSIEQEIAYSKQQQNFILSITHELKSPLSSIKLMFETFKKHELQAEIKNRLINNSLYEVERLENLVENVLLAAKIDNNSYGFSKKEINMSALSQKLVKRGNANCGHRIQANIEPNIFLKADNSGMTSIIVNLLENAVKYSPEESPVYYELIKENHIIKMSIKDEGQGIAEEEKQKVFHKFYRVGNEEHRATKGTGLGLYIVKELVKFHKGNIEILDNENKGSIFKIEFQA